MPGEMLGEKPKVPSADVQIQPHPPLQAATDHCYHSSAYGTEVNSVKKDNLEVGRTVFFFLCAIDFAALNLYLPAYC